MNSVLRRILVPSLALVGSLVAIPGVAHADTRADTHERREDRDRIERERGERERAERERRARFERERIERERREHHVMCERAWETGTPGWRLAQLGCYSR
ncbi:MAG TPA: hypothetical protein VIF62_09360 [Labilithrix sp.]